ncbi:MAG: adenosylmethionine decarboxylase [Aigarchaeota archaeon]|nr:adenosylmethionine decarboxylase [Candidatus Pelearchaeum maunauluense]
MVIGKEKAGGGMMRVVGKHVYGNLYDCDSSIINDERRLVQVVREAAEIANATLVEVYSWSFGGDMGGISVIALVKESHIALHSWSRYNYATLDVYTCGEHTNPEKGFDYIVEALKPRKVVKHEAKRSLE